LRFRLKYWKLVIFTLFLIYPNVSSTIFQMFQCTEINGASYMRSDMSIECFSPRWDSYIPLGLASLVIYPIGIPAGFFYFLSVEKHHLYTSKKVKWHHSQCLNMTRRRRRKCINRASERCPS
jgi:hypothetical protein